MPKQTRRTAVIGLAAVVLAACAQPTPPFRDRNGSVVSGSIAEEIYLPMKGAREYLLVRGRNRTAPIVLFLHGGPGGAETPLMRLYNSALEDKFVMAYWEQRGAGRSYSADIPLNTMTLPRFLDDLDHVVDHLRSELHQERIWLIGHSWGSALGMLYAKAHPEKLNGYIGTGQVASNPEDERLATQFVLNEATKRHDDNALADLKKIGWPPYGFDQLVVRDRLLDKFGGTFHQPINKYAVGFKALFETPETDIRDFWRLWQGTEFSQRALWPAFARLDLTKEVPEVRIPVIFVLGRYDQRTSSQLAEAYLKTLKAPQKNLIWLEGSAHNGPFEQPNEFRAAVVTTILHPAPLKPPIR